jgi:hypothetical protein
MSINEIIEEALTLKPQDRYKVIEQLTLSLDATSAEVEEACISEAGNRAKAYRDTTLKETFPLVSSKTNKERLDNAMEQIENTSFELKN